MCCHPLGCGEARGHFNAPRGVIACRPHSWARARGFISYNSFGRVNWLLFSFAIPARRTTSGPVQTHRGGRRQHTGYYYSAAYYVGTLKGDAGGVEEGRGPPRGYIDMGVRSMVVVVVNLASSETTGGLCER